MSKSPNLLLPVLGGIGLVLGAGYGIATQNYKSAELASAAAQAATVTARADAAEAARADLAARAAAAEAEAADLRARPVSASLTAPAPERDGTFGLGRAALPEEVAAWDVDVLPDGRGLPPGKGDVWTGEEVFADACASCHGDFAEGVDNWPVLAGGFDTLADEDPVKTVGSYWPYLSTVWDYVNRSMPFGAAQTLEADEVYAITAYILYSNDLVDDDFELSHENFADFTMHNEGGFVIDDRPEMEYAAWRAEPCMENCKDAATVTMRSVFLVEEPAEGGTNSVMNHDRGALDAVPQFTAQGPSFVTEAAA
ncbi:MAG: cytochrome c, partial [Pseudomonadota bacterium]